MATPPVFKEGDLTQKEDIGPREMVCDVCEVKAVKSCLTCNQYYCETHVKKHYTAPILQRHTLVDVTGDLEERLCQEQHIALDVFCRTDKELICSLCVESEHKGHDIVYDEIKQDGRQTQGEEQHQHQVLNEAPDQLNVDSVKTTSAAVSWNQPPGLDQTQHHFQISYHCPGTKPHITTTPSHSITLSDLKPATEYSVTVFTVLENEEQSPPMSTNFTTSKYYPLTHTSLLCKF
uniref:Fibronectin type-III domain-containing protein n=1 Tax=Hucho hucho TaxID=62062 RepID=A0A4W5P4M4_9TELE